MKKLVPLILIASSVQAMQQPRQLQVRPLPVQQQAPVMHTASQPFVFHKSASAALRTRAAKIANPSKVTIAIPRELAKNMKNTTIHTAFATDDLDLFNFFIQKEEITLEKFSDLAKDAVDYNSREILAFLLSRAKNIPQNTLNNLLSPADYGSLDNVKQLVDRGARGIFFEQWDLFPLHLAIVEASVEPDKEKTETRIKKIKEIIEKGADVNGPSRGKTALPLRITTQAVRALDNNTTPLALASGWGNSDIVKLLIEKSANVNAQNSHGWAPLHVASGYGHTETAKLLIDEGANINTQEKDGLTPLHLALHNGRVKTVKYLLDKKANINAQTKDGQTPLSIASENGHREMVELLIQQGANVNPQEEASLPPLYSASERGHTDIAKLLVQLGANVNAQKSDGETPLFAALKKGNIDMVELLFENGANPYITNKKGETALLLFSERVSYFSGKDAKKIRMKAQELFKKASEKWWAPKSSEQLLKKTSQETTVQPSAPTIIQPTPVPAKTTIIRLPKPTKKREAQPEPLPTKKPHTAEPEMAEAAPQAEEDADAAERLLKLWTGEPDKKARTE